jgi:hypothetical protein
MVVLVVVVELVRLAVRGLQIKGLMVALVVLTFKVAAVELEALVKMPLLLMVATAVLA